MTAPIAATALILAAASTGFATTLSNTAQVSIQPMQPGGTGDTVQTVQHPGVVDASASGTGGANSSGSGLSHTEYGVVRLSGNALGSLSTVARGSFRDFLIITAPGIPSGTPGTLTYTVTTAGSLIATTGASSANWSLLMNMGGGGFQLSAGGGVLSPQQGPPGYYGLPLGTYSAVAAFHFGEPTMIDIEVSAAADAQPFNGVGSGAASFDMPRAVTWDGLSNITADGVPVTTITLTSDSGTDWSRPQNTCHADFNGDGDAGTDADIEAFFACIAGNCCPACGSPDFNGDGDAATDADIEAFFRVLAGGNC